MSEGPVYHTPLAAAVLALCVALGVPGARAANGLEDSPVATEARADSPFGAYLAGLYARAIGDSSSAAEFYAAAISADTDPELSRGAFRALLAAGRIDDAIAQAKIIEDDAQGDGLAPIAIAIGAIRRGDFDEADRQLDTVPLSGMNVLLLPVAKAWVRVGQGRADEAIEALDPLRRSEQSRAFRLFHEALIYDLTEQREKAEEAYRALVDDRATRSLRIVQAYGLFLMRAQRAEEARALLNEYLPPDATSGALVEDARLSLEAEPPRPLVVSAAQGIAEALHGAVRFMFQNGDRESAAIYAQLALHLSPSLDVVRLLLGTLQESAQQWESAIATYRQVDPATPFGWNARLRIAASLRRLGKSSEAMALLRAMGDERVDRTDALIDLGDMLRGEQRWREAVDAYTKAIDRSGPPSPSNWGYYYSRGIALERSKRWPEAERDFLQALELQPEQPQVLNYLGYSWVEQGLNLDRARGMLERAVDLRPRDGYIIDSLGWVLYQLGDYDGAVENLERAIGLQPSDPVINDHLGDAYWRVGRKREARYQWERALIFDPEADVEKVIRRKLREGLQDI
jgi:tetratricopeptide (TPR) repeat protein